MPDITCPDCGSIMVPHHPARDEASARLKAVGQPRYSRRSRLRKKFHRLWLEKNQTVIMGSLLVMPIMGPPKFRCTGCGRVDGHYQTLGRSMLTVEPLALTP